MHPSPEADPMFCTRQLSGTLVDRVDMVRIDTRAGKQTKTHGFNMFRWLPPGGRKPSGLLGEPADRQALYQEDGSAAATAAFGGRM